MGGMFRRVSNATAETPTSDNQIKHIGIAPAIDATQRTRQTIERRDFGLGVRRENRRYAKYDDECREEETGEYHV